MCRTRRGGPATRRPPADAAPPCRPGHGGPGGPAPVDDRRVRDVEEELIELRPLRAQLLLRPHQRFFDLFAVEPGHEVDTGREHHRVRAEPHGHGRRDGVDLRLGVQEVDDPLLQFGGRRLADQLAAGALAEDEGDVHQQRADQQRGPCLVGGLAGDHVEHHAAGGEQHAETRGAVLGQHGPQGRIVVGPYLAQQATVVGLRLGADLRHGSQQRGALGEQGDGQDGQADDVALLGLRLCRAECLDALEEGEAAARDEDPDGREQGPEEAFLAVAEGVEHVRRTCAALEGGQQEDLVEAVGHRVCGFGEQRRRAGHRPADRLGHRDAQVGGECHPDRLPGLPVPLAGRRGVRPAPAFSAHVRPVPFPVFRPSLRLLAGAPRRPPHSSAAAGRWRRTTGPGHLGDGVARGLTEAGARGYTTPDDQ